MRQNGILVTQGNNGPQAQTAAGSVKARQDSAENKGESCGLDKRCVEVGRVGAG